MDKLDDEARMLEKKLVEVASQEQQVCATVFLRDVFVLSKLIAIAKILIEAFLIIESLLCVMDAFVAALLVAT